MKLQHLQSLKLDKKLYSSKFSLISSPSLYKPIRSLSLYKNNMKRYKQGLIEQLPSNIKMIEISPMTKAMIGMVVSVLAIA